MTLLLDQPRQGYYPAVSRVNPFEFGARLREIREAKGMTLSQVAKLIGKTAGAVSLWEGGGRSPDFITVVAIAKALNVDVAEFAVMPDHIPERPLGRKPRKPADDTGSE